MYRYRAFPRDLLPERRLINDQAYNFVGVLLMSVRERLGNYKIKMALESMEVDREGKYNFFSLVKSFKNGV